MDSLHASRVLMGDSLGFHIIFVLFGLTLPILVSWFEYIGLRRNDKRFIKLAKFWSKIMALLVIVGVISGTIIALQMSLVWPGILKFGGDVIGLPFMFETYAFLLEAVFLGTYMATWNNKKISPWLHWMFGLGIVVGSTLSAFAITSVNAWMNLPTGFTIVQGTFKNVDVFKAMFSPTSLIEFLHSMPGYWLAASLAIAALYAAKMLRTRPKDRTADKNRPDWVVIQKLMIFACAAFILTAVTADLTGKYLAKHEPAKLATIEMVDHTTRNAPFIFGGIDSGNGKITGPYIKIPSALSLLAGGSTTSTVTGLNDIPKNEQPPTAIRPIFNLKLTCTIALIILIVLYFLLKLFRPRWLAHKIPLLLLAIGGWLGVVVVEFGWMITEIGRQPWAVRGYVTTEQAVTKTHNITSFGYFFPAAYALLFAVTIIALRKIIRDEASKGRSI
ncbi:MAG TPA: cytochrome ubiquinol oxidase subunit I [Candidatus Saccharimonadales bacterium]|nr:cytochrome ubiquinol oxidase subunit I [Candidatus Saccharimonadales bacterium]